MPWRRRIWSLRNRIWRTASTTFPVPASPLVRIIAAPSAIRLAASPRSRQPQTKGTLNCHLSMWWKGSAGVRTSLSSMKSTPKASRIRASAMWPIRTLAMTGIETASWISRIFWGRPSGPRPLGADVGRDPFEGHHGHRPGLLGDPGLLGGGDVHDDATLEHLGKPRLHAVRALVHGTHLPDGRAGLRPDADALEPAGGIEPPTRRLRSGCSAC